MSLFSLGPSADLDATINTLQADVTTLDLNTAARTIDVWHTQLQGSADPTLQTIADDLQELRTLLTSGPLDAGMIGAVLTRLGTQTASAANTADDEFATRLQQLGAVLLRAGYALTGG